LPAVPPICIRRHAHLPALRRQCPRDRTAIPQRAISPSRPSSIDRLQAPNAQADLASLLVDLG
jgi:hypothetical protein